MGHFEVIPRRAKRLLLPVPARVVYKTDDGTESSETTRLIDVSALGAGFNLPCPIKRGRLVYLTIPLARQLRLYDLSEPQYKIWALVRHCIPVKKNNAEYFFIGTAFIGKNPPESYFSDPLKIYDTAENTGKSFYSLTDSVSETAQSNTGATVDRRQTRHLIPLEIILETLDADGKTIGRQFTVTENISLGGATVFTTENIALGTFLLFTSEQFNVSLKSIVRGKHRGADGIERLHLEFFDAAFPLEGIE